MLMQADCDTAALVEMDLQAGLSPALDPVLYPAGIDNVGLDFTDLDFIMEESNQHMLGGESIHICK